MSAVGAVVGLAAIASALGTRFARRRERIRRFADAFRQSRELSASPATYAPATGSQRADRDLLAAEPPPNVTVLGDVVQTRAGQDPFVLRWFVDAAATTWGCVGTISGTRLMRLYSSDGTTIYTTFSMWRRPAAPPAAPFVRNGFVPYQKGRAYGLFFHQEAMAKVANLTAIRTLDELCSWLTGMSRRIAEWRAAQPPDALLEYDLRSLLGKQYDRYARALARHLKLEIPTARLLA